MAVLQIEDILNLARLSNLELTTEEAESFRSELETILSFVQMLDSVDTKGLEPTYQVTGLTNVYREDEINSNPELTQTALLKNAPKVENGCIVVKRMLA